MEIRSCWNSIAAAMVLPPVWTLLSATCEVPSLGLRRLYMLSDTSAERNVLSCNPTVSAATPSALAAHVALWQ